ncbi:MAG: hypothetical protein H0W86_03070 [Armatimonadetes bacterium]|nr:hypothetical protein [Armatimonadota bacterium]
MIRALQDMIRRAETLSEAEQESIAAIINAEIDDEDAWQERFGGSSTTLQKLVDRAKKQYADGEYGDLDAK